MQYESGAALIWRDSRYLGTEKGGPSTVTGLRDKATPIYDILQPCPSDLHCLAGCLAPDTPQPLPHINNKF